MLEKALYEEDQKKIEEAVVKHAMGSYQMGEVAMLSAWLYDRGIDVIKYLQALKWYYEEH
ncbi:hypothetical protein NST17_20360 [Caldifermentibacillus hisashii]|uniref:Uncharacterized protein n=1 Tax=Caldifermentibacillus hisashii TaxID=996558 RepID=A0ABU9K3W4_9BACI